MLLQSICVHRQIASFLAVSIPKVVLLIKERSQLMTTFTIQAPEKAINATIILYQDVVYQKKSASNLQVILQVDPHQNIRVVKDVTIHIHPRQENPW